VFWNTHTRRLGNTEVQVLSFKEVPHVEEIPGPEQAPRCAVIFYFIFQAQEDPFWIGQKFEQV
jgi:hypothetical protein